MIWRLSVMFWLAWGAALAAWLIMGRGQVTEIWQVLMVLWALNGGLLCQQRHHLPQQGGVLRFPDVVVVPHLWPADCDDRPGAIGKLHPDRLLSTVCGDRLPAPTRPLNVQ